MRAHVPPLPGTPVDGTPVPGTPVPGTPVDGTPVPGTPVPAPVAAGPQEPDRPEQGGSWLSLLVAAAAPLEEAAAAVASVGAAVVHADGVAVTVTRCSDDRSGDLPLIRSTTTAAGTLARLELSLGEGPTAESRTHRRPGRTTDLRVEHRWPRWARRAGGLGVRSTLVVDVAGEHLDAALRWVSERPDHFDEVDEWAARRFAVAAEAALHTSQIATDLRQQRHDLERALHSRATIDQAIGILMARNGGTPDDAWRRLRAISQREGIKVAELARQTVEQASRRPTRVSGRSVPLADTPPLR